MKEKIWLKPEMIVALSAVLVSVFAVIVGVYSAYTDRTYARASVWPNVVIGRHTQVSNTEEKASFAIFLDSSGLGPAKLKYTYLEFAGREINSWQELVAPYEKRLQGRNISSANITQTVIPANKRIEVFKLESQNLAVMENFIADMSKLSVELCYCSVYEQCWSVKSDTKAIPVEICPVE